MYRKDLILLQVTNERRLLRGPRTLPTSVIVYVSVADPKFLSWTELRAGERRRRENKTAELGLRAAFLWVNFLDLLQV